MTADARVWAAGRRCARQSVTLAMTDPALIDATVNAARAEVADLPAEHFQGAVLGGVFEIIGHLLARLATLEGATVAETWAAVCLAMDDPDATGGPGQ